MKRREFIGLLGGAMAWPLTARGQQAAKVARLGFLSSASASSSIYKKNFDALRAGLHELGYVEGQNLIIESRWAADKYDRLPELAAELVRLNIDVLITHGTPATMPNRQGSLFLALQLCFVRGDELADFG